MWQLFLQCMPEQERDGVRKTNGGKMMRAEMLVGPSVESQNGPVENHGSSACFFVRSSSYSRQKGESGLHNSKTAVLEWHVAPPPTKQPWL